MTGPRAQSWALIDARGWVHAQPVTWGAAPETPRHLRRRKLRLVPTERQGDARYERLDPETGRWGALAGGEERRARHEARAVFNAATPAGREAEREARMAALEARVAVLEAASSEPRQSTTLTGTP